MTTYSSGGETFIRILPSILLFGILLWCCCASEAPRTPRPPETQQERQERRDDIQSQLVIRKVISTTNNKNDSTSRTTLQRLTSGSRAYSSFLSAVQTSFSSSSRGKVKFADCDTALQQAEEGTSTTISHRIQQQQEEETAVETSREDECREHQDTTEQDADITQYLSSEPESPSSSHMPTVAAISEEEEEEEVADDEEEAVVVTLDSRHHRHRHNDDLRLSNRTDESWIPSDSSCSSHSCNDEQSTPYSLQHHARRKSNVLARTISTSLKAISTTQQQQQQQYEYTSCDICLMDYEVGEDVCWSPNTECPHAFHVECILDWLLRNPHCPVCRRNYLEKKNNNNSQQNDTRRQEQV